MSSAIEWGFLVPAVLLLVFPADKLLSADTRLRSYDCLSGLRGEDLGLPWWWLAVHWIDPLRAFVGTWLLVRSLRTSVPSWAAMPKAEYGALLAVLALAALSQTFTRRDHGVLLAPVGFVCGVMLALMPGFSPYVGLAFALISMVGFRQFYAFFAVGMIAFPALGFLFGTNPALIGAGLMVISLPLLAGMLTQSALEMPGR